MVENQACTECKQLVDTQVTALHPGLIERNHTYNDTIYTCTECVSLLRLTNVPHHWSYIQIGPPVTQAMAMAIPMDAT